MNTSMIEKIKKNFLREDLDVSVNLNKNTMVVSIIESVEETKKEVVSEALKEANRLLRSYNLTKQSVVVKENVIVLNCFELSPLDLKQAFSKSKFAGLMKVTDEGLEIQATEFGLPLKVRREEKKKESLSSFKSALNKSMMAGGIEKHTSVKKEELYQTGECFFVISL